MDVCNADLVVGASAGSIVGTLLRGSEDMQQVYAGQATPPGPEEAVVQFDAMAMMAAFTDVLTRVTGEQDARARVGALALRSSDVPESERRAVIAGRIGNADGPTGRLVVTAVDTTDGSFHAFDAESDGSLVDAVVAAALQVFGTNPLSPATRQPAALAGRAQADAVWEQIAAFWG